MKATIGSKNKVLCDDGKVRTATVTGHADTWFSLPSRVKVNGKTVTGYISARSPFGLIHKEMDTLWMFSAYRYRKNHAEINVLGCKKNDRCHIYLNGITADTCDNCKEALKVAKEVIAAHPEIIVSGISEAIKNHK
jgi:hypothetical protein